MDDMTSPVIREALRHAEVKQASQLQIALAADTRAMTLCVATAGIAGVLISIIANAKDLSKALPIAMMAVTFFYSSCLAAWAARPIAFAAPGQDFGDFRDDIEKGRSIDEVCVELGSQLDEVAKENERRVADNARYFKAGLCLAASAPLVGLLTAVLG